jgi:hypothetical protein
LAAKLFDIAGDTRPDFRVSREGRDGRFVPGSLTTGENHMYVSAKAWGTVAMFLLAGLLLAVIVHPSFIGVFGFFALLRLLVEG